ncbi:hypothetical protein FGO68_gene1686 [Halteria grandinella]|uniref:Uncharacterized protein n=1 Tax=Halteria grandinella TaxID=5974 RepID=A0A8J8N938_HALGN|nr:hypothetical protein FGO68_gene1686 [Halteria grandinella]
MTTGRINQITNSTTTWPAVVIWTRNIVFRHFKVEFPCFTTAKQDCAGKSVEQNRYPTPTIRFLNVTFHLQTDNKFALLLLAFSAPTKPIFFYGQKKTWLGQTDTSLVQLPLRSADLQRESEADSIFSCVRNRVPADLQTDNSMYTVCMQTRRGLWAYALSSNWFGCGKANARVGPVHLRMSQPYHNYSINTLCL